MKEYADQREKVLARKDTVTKVISNMCLALAVSVLLFTVFLVVNYNPIGPTLYWSMMMSVGIILAHYFQYLCLYLMTKRALASPPYLYDPTSLAYVGAEVFFLVKQGLFLALIAAILWGLH